ncbi:MAG: putative E3 ubiquitin-protein ligase [Claussenomyces sp. TS43310]|nr:MAG: putative E3 ubiquitin-protein ligase [Claussenomyces sp. TS43310]
MAPWGHTLRPPNHTSHSSPASTNANSASPGRARTPSRMTSEDVLNHAYGIPTLQLPSGHQPSSNAGSRPRGSPSRRGHGRSLSHPFPSLFSGKKKQSEERIASDFDTSDDDMLTTSMHKYESIGHTARPSEKESTKDLTTGKCMTCDSTVRWPKTLSVFRCTICSTINDLKPVGDEGQQGSSRSAQAPLGDSNMLVPQLSTASISALVEQCVTFYLMERLKDADHFDDAEIDPDRLDMHPPWSEGTGVTATVPPIVVSHSPNDRWEQEHDTSRGGGPQSKLYSSSSPGSYESYMQSNMQQRLPSDVPTRPPPPPPDVRGHDLKDSLGNGRTQSPIFEPKRIFKAVEDHIVSSFTSRACLNTSFTSHRPNAPPRTASEGTKRTIKTHKAEERPQDIDIFSGMDAKVLLAGDFAENGSWWTGRRSTKRLPDRSRSFATPNLPERSGTTPDSVTVKSPRIDWTDLDGWYRTVLCPGQNWRHQLSILIQSGAEGLANLQPSSRCLCDIENAIREAQVHVQRVLLKAIETLLKRPRGPLKRPDDIRFLLIILANPLLYPSSRSSPSSTRHGTISRSRPGSRRPSNVEDLGAPSKEVPNPPTPPRNRSSGPGQHSGIIKRVLGLLANLPNDCHHYLVSWFSRLPESRFHCTVELIGSFVTYRLTRQHGKRVNAEHDTTAGLIPTMSASGQSSSAALHAALGLSGQSAKQADGTSKAVVYNDDWQIKAAARVMALLFSANKSSHIRKTDSNMPLSVDPSHSVGVPARESAHRHGQIVATSSFYNSLLDYSDLIADFEVWEKKKSKFAFCQYPFFLSIWAKIQIMEYDARRQMEVKAREAFFDSIMTRKVVQQYLILKIRRDCLVEDSLKAVSEVVGSGGEEIKKGLRIEFRGEEGIDAGGLRKEWFLLLVRDVFNPEHGMFTYDEDSQFCYFNPNSFETSDQFFLVGVVLGLAIYNSTILDIALPPFAFKKLLAAGPSAAHGAATHAKSNMVYTLEDLAEFRPRLAHGLRQLLDYEGDVETTFCRDFVADVERYGQVTQVPLCPDGANRAVTNSNRKEFVDLYVRYLLDTAVARQFEPFKRGFFRVCGGNALSLFQAEEIELLIRGSDEPLDISSLQAVAVCENWGVANPAATEPVIAWFWQTFRNATPRDQRKLLSFITGSDRIPAMGAANLVIKLSCLGDDVRRFPMARTCFNVLSLWRYDSFERLEAMLWRAVHESEGFGLK